MKQPSICILAAAYVFGVCALAHGQLAQTRPADLQISAQSTAGQAINIPAGDKPTVILFYRPEQRQSQDALVALPKALEDRSSTQTLVVVSGPYSADAIRSPYPIVLDRDYTLSGRLNVHAWPTTLLISPKGDALAHVGGIGPGYVLEVGAYAAFVSGDIDQVALNRRLNNTDQVRDSATQAAGRHLQVAQKFMGEADYDAALAEIDRGLKLDPASARLKVAKIRVLLDKGNSAQAKAILGELPANSLPPSQMSFIQGIIAAACGDAASAKKLLQDATRLNPNPAEAWFELGKVYEGEKDYARAAEAFRKAYEASH